MRRKFLKPLAIACGAAILFLNVTIVMNNKADSSFTISAGSPAMAQTSSSSSSSSSGSSSSGSSSSGSSTSGSSTSTGKQESTQQKTVSTTYYYDSFLKLWFVGTKSSITRTEVTVTTFKCCMPGQGSCASPTPECTPEE